MNWCGPASGQITDQEQLAASPGLRSDLRQVDQQLKSEGCYPVKGPIDLAVTSMQTMMDANLALQIKGVNKIIPLVMEPGCRNPRTWSGTVAGKLGTQLYVDGSSDEDAAFDETITRLVKELRDRIAQTERLTRGSLMTSHV